MQDSIEVGGTLALHMVEALVTQARAVTYPSPLRVSFDFPALRWLQRGVHASCSPLCLGRMSLLGSATEAVSLCQGPAEHPGSSHCPSGSLPTRGWCPGQGWYLVPGKHRQGLLFQAGLGSMEEPTTQGPGFRWPC